MLKLIKDQNDGLLKFMDGDFCVCHVSFDGMFGKDARPIPRTEYHDAIIAFAAENGPQPEPRHIKIEVPEFPAPSASLIAAIGAKPQKVEIIF